MDDGERGIAATRDLSLLCVLSSILLTCLTAYCHYFLFFFWEIIFRLSENITFRLSETFQSSFGLEAEKVSIVHVH